MQVQLQNILSQFTTRQLKINEKNREKSTEKLSSGFRINRAADDAANLCISEELRSRIRGLKRGSNNVQEGISWLQVADGAMNEAADILHRVKELAVQAANGINTESDREAITEEIQQLRQEMNRINNTTEFNTDSVFLEYFCELDVEGQIDDIKIFNSSYDDQTGDVTYGGVVYQGSRLRWDQIDPNMVYLDGTPPEQLFHGGDYTYQDPVTKKNLIIHCEDGAKVPEIKREIEIIADGRGISIDGNIHKWDELVDEDGFPYSEAGAHGGDWILDYGSAKLTFTIGMDAQSTSDMAKAINSLHTGPLIYKWTCDYAGAGEEKAVDANVGNERISINSSLASMYQTEADLKNAILYTVHAGEFQTGQRGIWLSDGNGTVIDDSFRSWDSMGIDPWKTDPGDPDWDTGSGISKEIVYTYKDLDNNGDLTDETDISFTFQLSDVTSEDSVIDGLEGMQISPGNIITKYSLPAVYEKPVNDKNVLHMESISRTYVTYDQEKELGRDFDQQAYDVGPASALQYDASQVPPTVNWQVSTASGDVVNISGTTDATKEQIKKDVLAYLQKSEQTILGQRINDVCTGTTTTQQKTLDEVVGAGNITTAGYFDGTFKLDKSSMVSTSNNVNDLTTYHCAFIDFQAISDVGALIGTGFDTTCATCTNHYSIRFVDSLNVTGTATTSNGYQYKMTSSGQDYLLEIDVSSLVNNSVTGSNLASAIVEIADDTFDFHYTQYAAEGSKLYVFDNRPLNGIDETKATFYTVPWDSNTMKTYRFELDSADYKSELDLIYNYNFSDVTDYIQAEVSKDTNGAYVQLAGTTPSPQYCSIADANGKSVVDINGNVIVNFDSSNPDPNVQKYDIHKVYKDGVSGANTYDTLEKTAEAYAEAAVKKMLTNTKTSLHTDDYSKLSISGDENDNKAITTLFDSNLDVDDSAATLVIQCSGKEGDTIVIPRFSINAGILRMSKASAMTREQAELTLRNVDRGLKWLSGVRTTYGGYQNRLEYTYSNNMNTWENTQAAESQIRDTDMAKAMVELSEQNIIQKAGEAMLSQNTKSSDWLLRLLEQ